MPVAVWYFKPLSSFHHLVLPKSYSKVLGLINLEKSRGIGSVQSVSTFSTVSNPGRLPSWSSLSSNSNNLYPQGQVVSRCHHHQQQRLLLNSVTKRLSVSFSSFATETPAKRSKMSSNITTVQRGSLNSLDYRLFYRELLFFLKLIIRYRNFMKLLPVLVAGCPQLLS